VYIGRKACGCCVAVMTDLGDKMTGQAVSEFIQEGLTVERVTFEEYRTQIVNEPGFMGCHHEGQAEHLIEY